MICQSNLTVMLCQAKLTRGLASTAPRYAARRLGARYLPESEGRDHRSARKGAFDASERSTAELGAVGSPGLGRSLEVASIKAVAIPPTVALPVSDGTGDVGLAGGDLDHQLDRAAAVRLLLDA